MYSNLQNFSPQIKIKLLQILPFSVDMPLKKEINLCSITINHFIPFYLNSDLLT